MTPVCTHEVSRSHGYRETLMRRAMAYAKMFLEAGISLVRKCESCNLGFLFLVLKLEENEIAVACKSSRRCFPILQSHKGGRVV